MTVDPRRPVDWWCTRCGGRAVFRAASIDPRYPLVKCKDCRYLGAGVESLTLAAASAQLVHERQHRAPGSCPGWCTRSTVNGSQP